MAKCEICGKGPMFGHNVSHSKRATNRQFRPNIQRKRLMIDGQYRRVAPVVCERFPAIENIILSAFKNKRLHAIKRLGSFSLSHLRR